MKFLLPVKWTHERGTLNISNENTFLKSTRVHAGPKLEGLGFLHCVIDSYAKIDHACNGKHANNF